MLAATLVMSMRPTSRSAPTMNPLERLPSDAISIAFLEAERNDQLPDRWFHDKQAPATIMAIARRGTYEVSSDQGRIVAREGEAFLAQDGQHLKIIHHGRRPGEAMSAEWLHARFLLFHTIDAVSLLALPPKLTTAQTKTLSNIIHELVHLGAASNATSLSTAARSSALGLEALCQLIEHAPMTDESRPLIQRAQTLVPVLSFIKNRMSVPLTVDDLARVAGLSRSRFFAFFSSTMSLPPMAYLKEIRLVEARNILIAGDSKLTSIAHATGFADAFHLSREFKRRFGLPPTEFRARHLAATKVTTTPSPGV